MLTSPLKLVSLAALTVVLAGCESTKLADTARNVPVESRNPVAGGAGSTGSGSAAATPQSQVASVDLNRGATAAANALPAERVVYFDYDSFVIKDDFKPVIDGYGRVLASQTAKKLIVEGHTDERGGREYNLALGQKRAEAVVRSLKLVGAVDGQLEAVSFGEERPAVTGAEEAARAKNRRAELKDR